MMPTSLHELIVRDEGGMRTRLYFLKGVPHIAAGHNLNARPISQRAAALIADDDIADTAADVQRLLPWTDALDPVRRAAIISVAYWTGMDGLLAFRNMLAAAKNADWTTAARELLDSTLPSTDYGRAQRLAGMLEQGEWK